MNHPADRGGPTKYGVTWQTLADHRGTPVTPNDIAQLSIEEAKAIYRDKYWKAPGFGQLSLSEPLMELLFDMAVHHGPRRAVLLLQRSISVAEDGHIGPITIEFTNRLDGEHLAALLLGERLVFIGDLITRDPSQAVFASGWCRRLREFVLEIPHSCPTPDSRPTRTSNSSLTGFISRLKRRASRTRK